MTRLIYSIVSPVFYGPWGKCSWSERDSVDRGPEAEREAALRVSLQKQALYVVTETSEHLSFALVTMRGVDGVPRKTLGDEFSARAGWPNALHPECGESI